VPPPADDNDEESGTTAFKEILNLNTVEFHEKSRKKSTTFSSDTLTFFGTICCSDMYSAHIDCSVVLKILVVMT
jgi:hypothetical protein